MSNYSYRWHRSIHDIPFDELKPLLGDQRNPFFKNTWLASIEDSCSISSQKGWQSVHLSIWCDSRLVAFAPLYLKGHSFGEFVFDQPFARLADHLGLTYYPKLIGMSPFSPVEGYRFFIVPDEDEREITFLMIRIIDEFVNQNNILSCNFLYVDPQWRELAEEAGCATWINQQSMWRRNNQRDFSDYLASFNANQRRNIKRERNSIFQSGLQISSKTGSELDPSLLSLMFGFYSKHCDRWGVWGSKYLARSFFESLSGPQLRENVVLFIASRQGSTAPMAMSLCVTNGEMLWGRYWGAETEIDSLHFELCFYSPIDWSLQNGIEGFDPGAGGIHKQRRGFFAKPYVSLHRWYDMRMNSLIRSWLPEANRIKLEEIKTLNEELPFRVEGPTLPLP